MTNETLTTKQRTFCEEYIVDLNATQAAIRAGYSAHTAQEQGSRLLSNVMVQDYLRELMEARSKRTQITADYVLEAIVETIERCRQNVRPMAYKDGSPVLTEAQEGELAQAFSFDAGAVLRGAELLGKHLKMFSDKQEIEVTNRKVISAEPMDLETWEQLYANG